MNMGVVNDKRRVSDVIMAVLSLHGKKASDFALYLGIVKQAISNKMKTEVWSVKELIKLAEYTGCNLFLETNEGEKLYLYKRPDKSGTEKAADPEQ